MYRDATLAQPVASGDLLRDAAGVVGFRFLERYLTAREAFEEQLGSFSAHRAWLQELVAGIDRDAASA